MAPTPILGLILGPDGIHEAVVEDWPADLPLPILAIAMRPNRQEVDNEQVFALRVGERETLFTGYDFLPDRYTPQSSGLRPASLLERIRNA